MIAAASLGAWEAIAIIVSSAVAVGGAMLMLGRWAWRRVVLAQLAEIKSMLTPNGLDTGQVGDATGRIERDLAAGLLDLAAQLDARSGELRAQHVALRGEVKDNGAQIALLSGRMDQHLEDATRDKDNLWRAIGRKGGEFPSGS